MKDKKYLKEINVKLTLEDWEMLKMLNNKYFLNVSALIRDALREKYKELENNETKKNS